MRPVKRAQGALAHPLNSILGTEANVRVLRVILLSDIPIGIAELAKLAALQASGLPRICARLEDLGVIEAVGRGRTRQFRRSQRGEIANWLATLFAHEQQRADAVVNEIRASILGVGVRAGWIEGAVARDADQPGEPIVVGVLVAAEDLERSRQQLWASLLGIQQRRDVVLELRAYTEADLRTLNDAQLDELRHARPLVGAPPADIAKPPAHVRGSNSSRPRLHSDADADLLRLATAIADKVKKDASILERARKYVERRLLAVSPGEQLELREWGDVLATMSPARIARLLVQDDGRGRRLRQSMPFVDVLSERERAQILRRRGRR